MAATLSDPAEPISPPPAASSGPGALVVVAAAAAAAAGVVHAAAAGTHQGDDTLVRLFAFAAVVQLGWAVTAFLRPTRVVLLWGAAINGVMVLAWVLSRTAGLPFVDSLNDVEPVGTQDTICAILGAIAAVAAGIGALKVAPSRRGVVTPVAVVGILALALYGAAAPHAHSQSHDHSHGDAEVAAAAGGHNHGGAGADTTPITSMSDPRLTPKQRAAAQQMLDSTRSAMQRFPDQASIEAAGYRSIGDSVTGFEHFVNGAYLGDSSEMDPNRIESIVMQVKPDGTKQVASAMYILTRGKTMADAPDIAGSLTTWHDHQNLCWDQTGLRVVGVTGADGKCTRGTFRPTAPMLHVWMTDTPCGPFSGIEGHGGDCASHSHGSK